MYPKVLHCFCHDPEINMFKEKSIYAEMFMAESYIES